VNVSRVCLRDETIGAARPGLLLLPKSPVSVMRSGTRGRATTFIPLHLQPAIVDAPRSRDHAKSDR
jgi:hypothetical protein